MKLNLSSNSIIVGGVIAGFLPLVAFVGLIGFSFFKVVEVAVPTGNAFLTLVAKDESSEAFQLTSSRYQLDNSLLEFEFRVQALNINNVEKIIWRKTSVSKDDTGRDNSHLLGDVHTKDGKVVKISLQLDREQGDWKIVSFSRQCNSAT